MSLSLRLDRVLFWPTLFVVLIVWGVISGLKMMGLMETYDDD